MATLVDVSGLVIYFTVAGLVLHGILREEVARMTGAGHLAWTPTTIQERRQYDVT